MSVGVSKVELSNPPAAVRRESPDAILAKNLVVARVTAGITQQALAETADVSRATIAQLESGYSDPRLSTIVDLADALGISPLLLLIGTFEAKALAGLLDQKPAPAVEQEDLNLMSRFVRSGLLKDRVRAAKIGAAWARKQSAAEAPEDPRTPLTNSAVILAALLSAFEPGAGTRAGFQLGQQLDAVLQSSKSQ